MKKGEFVTLIYLLLFIYHDWVSIKFTRQFIILKEIHCPLKATTFLQQLPQNHTEKLLLKMSIFSKVSLGCVGNEDECTSRSTVSLVKQLLELIIIIINTITNLYTLQNVNKIALGKDLMKLFLYQHHKQSSY